MLYIDSIRRSSYLEGYQADLPNDTKDVPWPANAAALKATNRSKTDAECQRAQERATSAQIEERKETGLVP